MIKFSLSPVVVVVASAAVARYNALPFVITRGTRSRVTATRLDQLCAIPVQRLFRERSQVEWGMTWSFRIGIELSVGCLKSGFAALRQND